MQASTLDGVSGLLQEIRLLRRDILRAESRQSAQIAAVRPRHRYSATNLVHYAEFRLHDLRDLQKRLSERGLSSMGRIESQVLVSIDALIVTLSHLAKPDADAAFHTLRLPDGEEILTRNAVSLLGPQPKGRATRIMVTLPSQAASDPAMVRNMLASGMDIARINCAHDGPDEWAAMVANIRASEVADGSECLVSMDLGGPKLRTGPIQPGPMVVKVKPVRNAIGTVLEPARLWLGTNSAEAEGRGIPVIPVIEANWVDERQAGDEIHLVDARGSSRTLTIEAVHPGGCLASVRQTVYLVPDMTLSAGKTRSGKSGKKAHVGLLPPTGQSMTVRRGDRLELTRDLTPAEVSSDGVHRIGCTLPEAFADAKPGERVLLDDGKIAGVITRAGRDELTVEVRSAGVAGTKLRAEKGINLPDTQLSISALTEQDIEDLAFVKGHADIVEVSFVRSAEDVRDLLRHLEDIDSASLNIVLKIETVAAFESLPQILLEAMRWEDIGVMIARGDLAVEAGFERMAEVQEEILWLCEAAHVPVIWATQVLDNMARTGLPSRAEVTDAAMAERAECVMLNKGPYIDEAISLLAEILVRMQDHTLKKRSLLRRLRAWDMGDGAPESSAAGNRSQSA